MQIAKVKDMNLLIDPKNHHLHNYMLTCNDICASIIHRVDTKKLSSYTLRFLSKEDAGEFEKVQGSDNEWQNWLMDHGYATVLYKTYYAHTFYSLIVDFWNFVFESIICAAKMKVSVSYALLRKPFKDTLAYIEWLYVDHEDMINKLIKEPSSELIIKPTDAKARIDRINSTTALLGFYNFRYDRDDQSSLEHIWNNTNHIITTHLPYSKTKQGDLNFIYPNEDNLREYSDYYYHVVPSLIDYATDLICLVFESLAGLNNTTVKVNHVFRTLRHARTIDDSSVQEIIEACNSHNVVISCPRCNKQINLSKEMINPLLDSKYKCKCGYSYITGYYMFDWEK